MESVRALPFFILCVAVFVPISGQEFGNFVPTSSGAASIITASRADARYPAMPRPTRGTITVHGQGTRDRTDTMEKPTTISNSISASVSTALSKSLSNECIFILNKASRAGSHVLCPNAVACLQLFLVSTYYVVDIVIILFIYIVKHGHTIVQAVKL